MSTPNTAPPTTEPTVGLACPRCGCRHLRVIYGKPKPGGALMRVRECRHCGRRIVTREKPIGR
ncbi:hypothetical protein [Fontivita pretiosa]|uniref:NrdR family transcriptional regulator n=1 Tax=Fontivita pretiosa TaxID=2989684 RepID=UPI003D166773